MDKVELLDGDDLDRTIAVAFNKFIAANIAAFELIADPVHGAAGLGGDDSELEAPLAGSDREAGSSDCDIF